MSFSTQTHQQPSTAQFGKYLTMSLELQQASMFSTYIMWASCAGYVAACMVTFALFFHSLFTFIKLFYLKKQNEHVPKEKLPYTLVTIYLMIYFIFTFGDSLTASNILTGISKEDYPEWRCIFASCIAWTLGGINHSVLFIILLYRIAHSFKGSEFAYKPCVYRSLFIIAPCPAILGLYGVYVVISGTSFVIKYDTASNLTWCAAYEDKETAAAYFIITAVYGSTIFIGYFTLLYLFIRGLWLLNKQMIEHFMNEHFQNKTILMPMHSPPVQQLPSCSATPTDQFAETENLQNNNNNTPPIYPKRLSVQNVMKEWHLSSPSAKKRCKPELERIVKLHNLIKKQTILVVTVIVTDITLAITAGINVELTNLNGWDIIINAICVWLMIDTSTACWNKCKCIFCWCCYYNTDQINNM